MSKRIHDNHITRAWETPDGWQGAVEHADPIIYATDDGSQYSRPFAVGPTLHARGHYPSPEAAHDAALELAPIVDATVGIMRRMMLEAGQ